MQRPTAIGRKKETGRGRDEGVGERCAHQVCDERLVESSGRQLCLGGGQGMQEEEDSFSIERESV